MIEQDFTGLLRDYPSIISDNKKFTGLVKDMLPGQPLQVNLLLTLYEMGMHKEIDEQKSITNTFAFRFVKQLVDERGVSRVNADWAVSIWCVCYGKNILKKPCEIRISTAKSGGRPAIADEQQHSKKQYQALFRFKKSSDGKGYAITGFVGDNEKTLIFPNTYHMHSVTAISEGAFKEREVQEAVITDGITVIEQKAFSRCTSLKQVIFPESLISIEDEAFMGCRNLSTAMLPRETERIGAYAFASTGVKSVELPDSIFWLGEGAYSQCTEVMFMAIPAKIEHISEKLFDGCISLKKVVLPETLLSIGSHAFANCINLSFITVPESVVSIGDKAFVNTASKFIMQCAAGSEAEKYARKNKLKFQLM